MALTASTDPTTSRAHLVEARELVKRYGSHTAVDGVTLVFEPGEIVAIIGPNGAGKSTTLELILGLRAPDSGEVTYWRHDARREIGVQLQTTPFFRGLTTSEHLALFASFYGVRLSSGQIRDILARCHLAEVARLPASKLSGGQQKRLAVALTLAHSPRLIFLDEPTAALDPRARHEIRELITTLAGDGTTVVFTSHDMEEVEKVASRVVLIIDGRVRAEGTPRELLAAFGAASLEALYLRLTAEEA